MTKQMDKRCPISGEMRSQDHSLSGQVRKYHQLDRSSSLRSGDEMLTRSAELGEASLDPASLLAILKLSVPRLGPRKEQLSTANVLSWFQLTGNSYLLIYIVCRTAGLLITLMHRTVPDDDCFSTKKNHAQEVAAQS